MSGEPSPAMRARINAALLAGDEAEAVRLYCAVTGESPSEAERDLVRNAPPLSRLWSLAAAAYTVCDLERARELSPDAAYARLKKGSPGFTESIYEAAYAHGMWASR